MRKSIRNAKALAATYGPGEARSHGASNREDALIIREAVSVRLPGKIEYPYKVYYLNFSTAIGSYEREAGARRPGPDDRFGRKATKRPISPDSAVGYKRRIGAS